MSRILAYCARFLVTDPSLDSTNLDSYASIVELQWYERNLNNLPPFKPGDILFLRDVRVSEKAMFINVRNKLTLSFLSSPHRLPNFPSSDATTKLLTLPISRFLAHPSSPPQFPTLNLSYSKMLSSSNSLNLNSIMPSSLPSSIEERCWMWERRENRSITN